MERDHVVILKPGVNKLAIDTKVPLSQPPPSLSLAQTTKNALKPSANTISNYCLKQYVSLTVNVMQQKQANNLRHPNGPKGSGTKGRRTNRTMATNKSTVKRTETTENSIAESWVGSSRVHAEADVSTQSQLMEGSKDRPSVSHLHNVGPLANTPRGLGLLHTPGQVPAMSVNISINHQLVCTNPLASTTKSILGTSKATARNTIKPQVQHTVRAVHKSAKSILQSPAVVQSPPQSNAETHKKVQPTPGRNMPRSTKALSKPCPTLNTLQCLLQATTVSTTKAESRPMESTYFKKPQQKVSHRPNLLGTSGLSGKTKTRSHRPEGSVPVTQNQLLQLWPPSAKPGAKEAKDKKESTANTILGTSGPKESQFFNPTSTTKAHITTNANLDPNMNMNMNGKDKEKEKEKEKGGSAESSGKQNGLKSPSTKPMAKERYSNLTARVSSTSNAEKELVFPLTAAQALRRFADKLTDDEKGELLDYKDVYYMGPRLGKTSAQWAQSKSLYDDDKGDYNAVVGEQIAYRYEILEVLGKGSFGQAIKCFDHKTKEYVAVKMIRSKKRFYHQAMVEVKVLKYLRDNDVQARSNVVRILDSFTFRKHICIAFELLNLNLYDLIKNNNFRGFSLPLIRKFAVQILQTLCFLKENAIIHCDLKPENILLKQENRSEVKLIDFGSSCFADERVYTYIQSRFYRAPEIMLAIPYTTAIDIWSFGCILAELFTGFPIFPGESEPEQMALIMEVNGLPPTDMLEKATRKDVFFAEDNTPLSTPISADGTHQPGSKTLQQALRCTDPDFVDFLRQCFVWEPELRMTPETALAHPWISKGTAQLVLRNQRSNNSISIEKGPSLRHSLGNIQDQLHGLSSEDSGSTQAKMQQTQRLVAKPKVNQSLVTTRVCEVNMDPNSQTQGRGVLSLKQTSSKPSKPEPKICEKLLQLKQRLQIASVKQPLPPKRANNQNENRSLLLHVLAQKSVAVKDSSHKPALHRSKLI